MKKKIWTLVLGIMLITLFAGCSSNSSGSGNAEGDVKTIDFLSEDTPDKEEAKIFTEIDSEIPETSLEIETIEQTNILQQISLLSASNDLPDLFKYESNQLGELIDNGQVLDMGATFKDLGLYEELNPAAVNLLEQLSDGRGLYTLPVELNIEGFWYNKQIFEENNLEVPETWDEMMEVSDQLIEAGVQPFSVAGKEKWPMTRYINAYLIRLYGVDVMDKVANGELSATDEGFVEAASVVQEMNQNGYFGQGVNTIDQETALSVFMQGDAAMYYSGSWDLASFNDEERNPAGVENIGLFNIPLVEGGEGTLQDWNMNAGLTLSASADKYDEQMGEWMKQVFTDYGDKAMQESGMISGFVVDEMPEDISPLTEETLENMNNAENAALWFEARFNPATKTLAEDNVQLLVNGDMSPEEYMETLQNELE